MKRVLENPALLLVMSAVLFASLFHALRELDRDRFEGRPVKVYCAAGLMPAFEAIAADYDREFGVEVIVDAKGSGELLGQLKIRNEGELYLAGDDSYIEEAQATGLVAEAIPVANMKPVLAVRRGNPKGVRAIEDLLDERVRVGLANHEAAAVGRIARKVLMQKGIWATVKERVTVFKPTVTHLANDLKIGTIDLAILWDATVNQYPEIDAIPVAELDRHPRAITMGVLTNTDNAVGALHFARYASARDRGLLHFAKHGYAPVEGDVWAHRPELDVMLGGMLSDAVEKTLIEFEEREGVIIRRAPGGCGTLVAQMRAGAHPDAFFSCDEAFLDDVQHLFDDKSVSVLSKNDIVMITQKGNPKQIRKLEDLCRKGLRIGVGHPQDSALGKLTKKLLQERRLYSFIEASDTKTQTPTADMLVAQIGSLDAAIVYRSSTANARHLVDVIPIDDPLAHAQQPIAIGRSTQHRELLQRLFARLRSATSKQRFEALGFHWKLGG